MKILKVRVGTRRLATALAAIVVVTAAILVTGRGYQTSQVRMHAGTVWLASSQIGHATLVDGATAHVAAQVKVAPPRTRLSVTQHPDAAYVLNQATGALVRIDGATERVSPPLLLSPAAQVLPAPHMLYAVDTRSGMATSADPDTLALRDTHQPLVVQVSPDSLVVDSSSRLWAIDNQTGELIWLNGTQRKALLAGTQTSASRLTLTADQPALVDPARRAAELLDPNTGSVIRSAVADIQPSEAITVSGSPDRSRLLLVVGARGALIVCAFDTSSCTTPVTIGSPGSDLGTPVEVADHAIVPNYSTGQATIINLTTMRIVAQRQLFDQPTRFELLTRDGFVFFNDPNSNRAGVLDLAGNVRTITKHDQPRPGNGDTPTSSTRTQPIQPNQDPSNTRPTGSARREGRSGPGIMGTAGGAWTPPPPVSPSPSPAVSIVVKPHNHGLVGDQFEFALVPQRPTTIADAHWQFGDGAEATGTTVRHRWQRPGVFPVRAALTLGTQPATAETTVIVDPPGASPRITQMDIRRPAPVIGEQVNFSADVTGNPDKWVWTVSKLGQPTTEISANTPEFHHAFATPGTYSVTLTITAGSYSTQASRHLTVALGVVRAWGYNIRGQTSVPPEATSGVIAIAAGALHSLALKANGSVIAWGDNFYGQVSVPPEAISGVVAISAGFKHSLALKTDGSVIAWGYKADGEWSVPPQATSGVIAIAAGNFHNLALKADGSVIAWGEDFDGQLSVPPQATSGVIAIAAGNFHNLALKADGSVIAWGSDYDGQISVPPPATGGVIAIAAGDAHSLALKADGSVIDWGYNADGEWPVPPQATSGVIAIAAGRVHRLALKADGSVIGWGDNYHGQITVPPDATSGVLSIAAGLGHSLSCQ